MTARRRLRSVGHSLALALLLVLAVAVATLAYWTISGSGPAFASTDELRPPTAVVASLPDPNARTVSVSWTPPSAPDGGMPDGYFVERLSGADRYPACATSAMSLLSGATVSCVDTDVASGTFTYVVTAVFRSWTAGATSDPIEVPASVLASFMVVPSTASTVAGAPLNVTITALDQYGATFTGYTGAQCLTFSGPNDSPNGTPPSYPAAAQCASGSSVTFSAGVATVPVTLVRAEITALDVTDTPTTKSGRSEPITVTFASAARLAFAQQPSNGQQNIALTVQPWVAVQDQYGNVVTNATAPVSLAITAGTGTSGAVLSCTTNPLTPVAGVAAFTGCRINLAGTNYTLTASAASLTSSVSTPFTITSGTPRQVSVHSGSGQSTMVATPFGAAMVAYVRDNTSPLAGVTVTFTAPASGPSGTFAGNALTAIAVTDSNGLATAPSFAANTIAGTYNVTASVGSLTPASFALTNTPGSAAKLAFTQQPSASSVAGQPFASQPRVAVQDQYGNLVTSATNPVTLALTSGTGTPGAVLACATNPLAAQGGVAAFTGCNVNLVGSGYTLTASSGQLTPAVSGAFAITAAAPASIVIVSGSEQSATVNTAFGQPLVARVADAFGNVVSGASVTFTAPAAGASGTFPGGGRTVTIVTDASGLATSPTFTANTVAGAYAVTAAATGTNSISFGLTNTPGPATKLAFVQQPSSPTVAGQAFGTQPQVAIQDQYGNLVTTATTSVSLAVTGGGATLSCASNPTAANAGVATFASCTMTKAGSYTLTASGGSLSVAVSASFTITAAAPATIAVVSGSGQTTVVNTDFAQRLVALVSDAYGNPVGGATVTFSAPTQGDASGTFKVGSGSPSASVQTAATGVATSPVFTADTESGSYNVTASAPGTNTIAFALTNAPGAPVKLTFIEQPSNSQPGVAFATQPKVAIEDQFGNTVTTASSNVTLAITSGTGTAGAVLSCAANPVATVQGVATFAGCSINLAGTGYTLTASGAFPSDISTSFTIAAGLTPSSLRLANTGSVARTIDPGDTMVVGFSGTVRASTICSNWTSDTEPYSVNGVFSVGNNSAPTGNDQLTLSAPGCGTFRFGYVDLGRTNYTTTNATYNATIVWEPSAQSLTVTIGALASGTPPATFRPKVTATYVPAAGITDPDGGPISGTATYVGRAF
jgi:trimeric autotransporter adhesin